MFIIVEGVDGSGKSSLVNRLAELADDSTLKLLHRGPIKAHPMEEYALSLGPTSVLPHAIADRWHLGEMIYGPKYRGVSRVTAEMLEWFELFLESRGALRIMMGTPLETIIERVQERGDDMVAVEDLTELHGQYQKLLAMMPNYMVAQPRNLFDDNVLKLTLEVADTLARKHAHLSQVPSYVGPRHVDALIAFDGDAQLAGFPESVEAPGFWAIRAVYNTRGLTRATRVGLVNSSEVSTAQLLTGAQKVIYARNIPRPMKAANDYIEEALS